MRTFTDLHVHILPVTITTTLLSFTSSSSTRGLAVASIARDVVEMTPPRDDNVR